VTKNSQGDQAGNAAEGTKPPDRGGLERFRKNDINIKARKSGVREEGTGLVHAEAK